MAQTSPSPASSVDALDRASYHDLEQRLQRGVLEHRVGWAYAHARSGGS
jgi:hypothetical protein